MSVIIKGINKPKMCKEGEKHCFAWNDEQYRCNITKWEKSCPLVEIPTPHGRLIDKDELLKFFMDYAWDWSSVDGITTTTALKQVIRDVKNAPTILEAEE